MCDECGFKHEDDGLTINGIAYDKYGNPKPAKSKKKKAVKK